MKQLIAGIKGSKPGSGPPKPDGHLSKEESRALDRDYRIQRNETLRLKNFKEQMLLAKTRGELIEIKLVQLQASFLLTAMRPAAAKLPPELNGTPFYGFDIANGVIRPSKAFKDYARIKKAKLFYNGKALYYVVFGDTYRWQHVNFADIMANQGDNMILEILDVYPGTKSPNAAVTEIILQGAH